MVSCISCGLSHNARKLGVTFHRFPKNPERRAAWIKFLKKTEESVPKFAVLCSQHFKESDFDKSAFKILLRQNVVPSIFVRRHKYEKISSVEPVPTVSTDPGIAIPCSSKDIDAADPMDTYEESLGSIDDPDVSQIIPELTADTPRKVKLRRQIRKMSKVNLRQYHEIRKLQKRTWFQKKRIFKLTSVIRELHKKNFVNAGQVVS